MRVELIPNDAPMCGTNMLPDCHCRDFNGTNSEAFADLKLLDGVIHAQVLAVMGANAAQNGDNGRE